MRRWLWSGTVRWVTTDKGFRRFKGLGVCHPLR